MVFFKHSTQIKSVCRVRYGFYSAQYMSVTGNIRKPTTQAQLWRDTNTQPPNANRKCHFKLEDDAALYTALIWPHITEKERYHCSRCTSCRLFIVRFVEYHSILLGRDVHDVLREFLVLKEEDRLQQARRIDVVICTSLHGLKPRCQKSAYQLYLREFKSIPNLALWKSLTTEQKRPYTERAASLALESADTRTRLTARLKKALEKLRRQPKRSLPPILSRTIKRYRRNGSQPYKQFLKNISSTRINK